jgi:mRNA turnover protein 4
MFFGKNKVMQLALGRSSEDEYQDNLRRVAELMNGNVSLFSFKCV